MEKVGCAVLCRAASWLCYDFCTYIKAAQLDQRLKNDPSNPNHQTATNSHVSPVPSKRQGLCDRDYTQFFHTEV